MRYYKIHLGQKNSYANIGVEQNIIGIGFNMPDLSGLLSKEVDLKESIRNLYSQTNPETSKGSVASATGMIFRFLNQMEIGDIVIVPLGDGTYKVGEIISDYLYRKDLEKIPHTRNIQWKATLVKDKFSENLKNTMGAIGTISDITHHSTEIEALLSGNEAKIESVNVSIDQSEFALEKHLEEFIIDNWSKTEFANDYDLFKDDEGEIIAQQFPTEVGYMDILAIKKDKSEILVIELKKGRSGDAVVGQTLRYITAIRKEIAEENQKIRAIIITGQDDKKIRYSIEPLSGIIEFMVYTVQFSLTKIL